MTDLGFWHGFRGVLSLPFKALRIISNPVVLDALGWVCGFVFMVVVVGLCIGAIRAWKDGEWES